MCGVLSVGHCRKLVPDFRPLPQTRRRRAAIRSIGAAPAHQLAPARRETPNKEDALPWVRPMADRMVLISAGVMAAVNPTRAA